MKRPDISDYIKQDPSELSNAELLIGYQNYSKVMDKYVDHIEQMNSSNDIHHVSQQRELLLAFMEFYHSSAYSSANTMLKEDVDAFLEANNCG